MIGVYCAFTDKLGKKHAFATQKEFAAACGLSKDQIYRRMKRTTAKAIYNTHVIDANAFASTKPANKNDVPAHEPSVPATKKKSHTKKKKYKFHGIDTNIFPCPQSYTGVDEMELENDIHDLKNMKFVCIPENAPSYLWMVSPYLGCVSPHAVFAANEKILADKKDAYWKNFWQRRHMPKNMRPDKDEVERQLENEKYRLSFIISELKNKAARALFDHKDIGQIKHIWCRSDDIVQGHFNEDTQRYAIYLNENDVPCKKSEAEKLPFGPKDTSMIFELLDVNMELIVNKHFDSHGNIYSDRWFYNPLWKHRYDSPEAWACQINISAKLRKEIFGEDYNYVVEPCVIYEPYETDGQKCNLAMKFTGKLYQ